MWRLIKSNDKDSNLLQNVIHKLMQNDQNATWYECKNLKEVEDGLENAILDYKKDEDTYIFYNSLLNEIKSN